MEIRLNISNLPSNQTQQMKVCYCATLRQSHCTLLKFQQQTALKIGSDCHWCMQQRRKRYSYLSRNKENFCYSSSAQVQTQLLDKPRKTYIDSNIATAHSDKSYSLNPSQRYQTGYHFKLRESLKQNDRNMHYLRQIYNEGKQGSFNTNAEHQTLIEQSSRERTHQSEGNDSSESKPSKVFAQSVIHAQQNTEEQQMEIQSEQKLATVQE